MTNRTRAAKCLGVVLLVLAMLSCTEGQYAVFYTIENEKKISDNPSLPNNITVTHFVELGNTLYVSAGAMWARSSTLADASVEWKRIENSLGEAMCNGLVVFSTELVAAFFSRDEQGSTGLYRATPTADLGADAAPTLQWSEVSLFQGKQVVWLSVVGGSDLLVCVAETASTSPTVITYALYASQDGSTFSGPILQSLTGAVSDATHDGTNYWIVSGNKVYTGPALSAGSVQETTVASEVQGYSGVLHSSDYSAVYLSTQQGRVYRRQVGSSEWTSSEQVLVSAKAIPFTRMLVAADRILVGTEGYGYYEVIGGDVAALHRFSNITSVDFYAGIILRFHRSVLEGQEVIFACTSGAGLWRGTYSTATSGTATSEWNRE